MKREIKHNISSGNVLIFGRYKALSIAVLCGLTYLISDAKDAVAQVIEHGCIKKNGCRSGHGTYLMVLADGTSFTIEGRFNQKGVYHGCNTYIEKNGRPRWKGPGDNGEMDTVDMASRCDNKLGVFYYDDHTDERPHYDKGEWKDGRNMTGAQTMTIMIYNIYVR